MFHVSIYFWWYSLVYSVINFQVLLVNTNHSQADLFDSLEWPEKELRLLAKKDLGVMEILHLLLKSG